MCLSRILSERFKEKMIEALDNKFNMILESS